MNRPAIRNVYMLRFVGRVVALICCVIYCIMRPEKLVVLEGMNFFKELTLLHVLWVLWQISYACCFGVRSDFSWAISATLRAGSSTGITS